MSTDFVIPVSHSINAFREHLKCHPRTILSARFGDGKSFFLNAFRNDSQVRKEFVFLTVYPVNYQVLENKDIFDVIKYDILLQMGMNGMIDPNYEISSQDAFLFCLKSHGLDLLETLFGVADSIDGYSTIKAVGAVGKSAISVVKKIQEAVCDYKAFKEGKYDVLTQFVESTEHIVTHEDDPITKLIQSNLDLWRKRKENKGKRIVLLFEDMDRIDPAHLFRILNIFSAHMDYSYKYGVVPNPSLGENKFGVDNVVMVVHYRNLESIFAHFYGEDTCFDGYINKFADKGLFEYSLKAEAVSYYYDVLSEKLLFSKDILKQILKEELVEQKTLRELWNSLDRFEEQRLSVSDSKYDVPGFMVILRRLGFTDNEVCQFFQNAVYMNYRLWLKVFYPYFVHFGKLDENSLQIRDPKGIIQGYYFSLDGKGEVLLHSSSITEERNTITVPGFIEEVLNFLVVK